MGMFVIFLFLIVGATETLSSKTRGGYKEAIESCNQYVDDVLLDIMTEYGEQFDPYVSADSVLLFSRKVVFVDVKGEAKLAPGYLSGLNKIRRIAPCAFTFEDDRLKLIAKLHIPDLTFNATGSLKFMKLGPEITVHGDSTDISVKMAFTLNFTTGREALLDEFKLDTIKDMHIWVNGLRLLKWLHSAVQNSATNLLKIIIRNSIEHKMRDLVAEKVISNPFSLEDFDIDEQEIVNKKGDPEFTTPFPDEDYTPTGYTSYTKEEADSYIDNVIENRFIMESDYNKIDPYPLCDVQIDDAFIQNESEKQLDEGNNYLKVRNGHLEHVSKLKRLSHCTKPVLRISNITFECFIGFDGLKFTYEASNGDSEFDYELIASVTDTKMSFRITSNQIHDDPHLQDFTVDNIGTFTVKAVKVITGSTCFSERPYNLEPILKHFETSFVKILYGKFRDILGYSVYRTHIPFLNA